MKKKFLALALALVMCLSLLPVSAAAADEFQIENGVLVKYNGKGGDVTIPAGVTEIGKRAFLGCTTLTSVTIPNSVQIIGENAFTSCESLTSIDIPDSVKTIGYSSFSGTRLTSVTIPNGVQAIGGYAFSWNDSLVSVTIPDSVRTIGEGAFYECDKLTNITVPPTVKEIGNTAIGYHLEARDPNIGMIGAYPYPYGHVTIHGQAGSAAETYAKENNIKFVADWNGGTTEPTPTPEIDPVKKFTDVNTGDWFVNAVKYVLNKNLFKGTSGKTFEPNTTTNRAMFVVVLARGDGAAQKGDKIWYDRDVQWAVSKGYYDGKDPEGGIPRQEMALILYRRAGSPEVSGDLSKYNDVSGVSGEVKDALVWAVQTGYLKGVGGGRLNPQGTATRAEVATIFMRVFG